MNPQASDRDRALHSQQQKISNLSGYVIYRHNQSAPLPPGALRLKPDEVLKHRLDSADAFRPREQVWSLPLHDFFVTYPTLISSTLLINNHRFLLSLGSAKVSYSIACAVIPTGLQLMLSQSWLRDSLLVNPMQCQTCVALRGASLALGCGIVLPYLYSFFMHRVAADMTKSAPVPPLRLDRWREHLALMRRFFAADKRLLGVLAPCVALYGGWLADRMRHHSLTLSDASLKLATSLSEQLPQD